MAAAAPHDGDARAEDPRAARSRQRVLAAATTCFLAHGYDATTVEQVAVEAGLAKRTVFNLYADKPSLFRAALERSVDTAERFTGQLLAHVHELAEAPDLRAGLGQLAEELALTVLAGPVVPLRRLLAREGERFPDLLADYRRRAPEAVLVALSSTFTVLAARKRLSVTSPDLAAEHFAFLVMGADLDRGMLGEPPPPAARIRERAAAGVDAFWRAHLPDQTGR
ncbi:TetR/AcrR family transcriptional regulator [Streptomyces sp. NP160]|uniref:TetR/AcrR family transcriptional regulator n=1 Tax=Streptomyces sp. NP160 TaxID=2586637 RepID=UPI00111B4011|nr:TetR/AcrR family transcriptional regulator [Streptomyces sp. NP160]TNM70250.1 TetR/AcrR family transcriptional regulator [Streptomyces sp. NP160]